MNSVAHLLHSISRVYHDNVHLDVFVRKAGTENCEARFRMTRQQERIVRKHFGIRDDLPIQFASSELAEVGNGWWVAFSLSERPDEALKAILNIKAAFYYAQNAEYEKRRQREASALASSKIVARVKPKRVVLVKYRRDQYGHASPIAVDRTKQALCNPAPIRNVSKELDDRIKALMCDPQDHMLNDVNRLRSHFGK